jgi:pimeloyl-ACP methyl ester carboxylesterase
MPISTKHPKSRKQATAKPKSPSILKVQGPSHFPMGQLRWAGDNGWMPRSRALLCRNSAHIAVVFIHGWGGSAGDTWETFPAEIRSMPQASKADVFFIEYGSLKDTVEFCAAQMQLFLNDVLHRPLESIVNPSLPRSEQREPESFYERVVLVAHSMGAVIARRAVLNLERDALSDEDRGRFTFLFFAPAHKGSEVAALIQSGLCLDWLPGASLLGKALTMYYRSLEDLTVGSQFLQKLEADSRSARESRAEEGAEFQYLRAHVYHAQEDKVVVQVGFDDDHPLKPVMRHNHRSICKPNRSYQVPTTALRVYL